MTTDTSMGIQQALEAAIKEVGTQVELAEMLTKAIGKSYSQQQISHWLKVSRVPAEHAIALERVTGIAKHLLCPQVFKLEIEQSEAAW